MTHDSECVVRLMACFVWCAWWCVLWVQAWRGNMKQAAALLDECHQRCVEHGKPIELPHCQR